jgi:hypothetical protein
LFSLLSGCATNLKKEIDEPVCVEETPDRAYCVTIITGREFFIDDEHPYKGTDGKMYTWWEIRPAMLQLPPGTWHRLKVLLIKLCKDKKAICDKEVFGWDRTVQKVEAKREEKVGPVQTLP